MKVAGQWLELGRHGLIHLNAVITAFIVIPIISKMATKIGKRKAFLVSTFFIYVGYILKWWGFDIELNEKFNQTELGQTLTNGLASIFNFLDPYLDSIGMSWFSIDTLVVCHGLFLYQFHFLLLVWAVYLP